MINTLCVCAIVRMYIVCVRTCVRGCVHSYVHERRHVYEFMDICVYSGESFDIYFFMSVWIFVYIQMNILTCVSSCLGWECGASVCTYVNTKDRQCTLM